MSADAQNPGDASPVQTAGGLLIDAAGRILLGLRAHHKRVAAGYWDIIGGHLKFGESAEDALVREIHEELGVTPTCYRLIASVCEPPSLAGETGCVHHVFLITEWTGGGPRNACDEHARIGWFRPSEIRELANKTPFDFDGLLERAGVLAATGGLPPSR
jgi:8-oxo-dGTP pyrophosphatase MutT (NUDIX family)